MAKTVEEVQSLAIQRAAGQHGMTWHTGQDNSRMTRGMKLVMSEARKRGLIIQSESDLTQQVIQSLAGVLMESAHAFATSALSLGALNQEVQGTEYAGAVKKFNNELLQGFGTHILNLNHGVAQTMFGSLRPFEIEEKPLTLIQRLLAAD